VQHEKSKAAALRGLSQHLSDWLETRSPPVVATIAFLVIAMAYSLWWSVVAHGGHLQLSSPGDLWSITSSSSSLLHGEFGRMYERHIALTSPPGYEFVLAPAVGLGQLLGLAPHLKVSGEPLSLWFVIGPVAILTSSVVLFAVDAVARFWGIPERWRLALALVGGVGVASVVQEWGHPEDCVALALVIWSALALERGRVGDGGVGNEGAVGGLAAAGWLLGLAVAFQPLALLAVTPIFARVGWRSVPGLTVRLVLPSLLVLIAPLSASASHTIWVLTKQPVFPDKVSSTPWSHFAPSIGHGEVAGGPTRLLSTALGAVVGFVVCRRRHDLATVLTLTAVALALRVLFESELCGYYFWPVAALCLLLSLRRGQARFVVCAVASAVIVVVGNHRVHTVGWWWVTMMIATAVLMLTAIGREVDGGGGTDGGGGPSQRGRSVREMDGLEIEVDSVGARGGGPA
jgi:hypothetical protein